VKRERLIRWFLAVAAGSFAWGTGWCETVVAIKDKDITPYNQAISGLEQTCPGIVQTFDMDRIEKEGGNLLEKVRGLSPKAIVTVGSRSADFAAQNFKDVPVVFCMHPEPEVSFQGRANAIGIPLTVSPLEQFKSLKQVTPKVKRLGVVYCMAQLEPQIAEGTKQAATAGLTLTSKKVEKPEEVPAALKDMTGSIDAVWVLPDKVMLTPETYRTLILVSVDYGLPLLVYSADFVRKGALLAVYPDFEDTGRKTGDLVNGIVANKPVSELKPGEPTSLWALNLNIAQRLNITVTEEIKKKPELKIIVE
jgi:ABC-type uncharacterized transport system substrate-binding protein